MAYGQSNADRYLARPRLPSPLLEQEHVITLTAGMGVRGCGYNIDGTRKDTKGEFTIAGRRVRPEHLPPVLPVTFNDIKGTSLLHVAGAVATGLCGAPAAAVRAAAVGGLRLVALPDMDGIAGIYRLADGSISPVLTLLSEEAGELRDNIEKQGYEAPSHIYILFIHGEADRSTPAADYVRQFHEARALIAEGLARHGLTPRWILTQAAGTTARGDGNAWQSRLAILDVVNADPELCFAGPLYPYPLIDHIHYDAVGKAMIGELCAHAIAALEQGQQWATPMVVSWVREGKIISLRCETPEPLVLDDQVAGLSHYGFTIEDGPTIQNVTLKAGSQIVIELTDMPQKAFHLRYAFRRTSRKSPEELRPHAFAQGAVRTDWGVQSEIIPGQVLRKWLPGFVIPIPLDEKRSD